MPNVEFEAVREIIGEELTIELQAKIGGCRIYIPRESERIRKDRDAEIVKDYAFGGGLTLNELSRKYGLCEPHVRKIVRPLKNTNS